MSATEIWLLVAAIVAGAAAILRLAGMPPPHLARLGDALASAAVALVAIALLVALP